MKKFLDHDEWKKNNSEGKSNLKTVSRLEDGALGDVPVPGGILRAGKGFKQADVNKHGDYRVPWEMSDANVTLALAQHKEQGHKHGIQYFLVDYWAGRRIPTGLCKLLKYRRKAKELDDMPIVYVRGEPSISKTRGVFHNKMKHECGKALELSRP